MSQSTRYTIRIYGALLIFFLSGALGLALGPNDMPIVKLANRLSVSLTPPLFAIEYTESRGLNDQVAPLSLIVPRSSRNTWDLILTGIGLKDPAGMSIDARNCLGVVNVHGNLLRVVDHTRGRFGPAGISSDCSRIVWQNGAKWFARSLRGGNPVQLKYMLPQDRFDQWGRAVGMITNFKISANGKAAVFVTITQQASGGFVDTGRPHVQWIDLETGESVVLDSHYQPEFLVLVMQEQAANWMNLLVDISPDGTRVLSTGAESPMSADRIYIHDPANGTSECLTCEGQDNFRLFGASEHCPAFHPNGEGVCFIRSLQSPPAHAGLIYRNLNTGEETILTTDITFWNSGLYLQYSIIPYFMFIGGGSDEKPDTAIIDRLYNTQTQHYDRSLKLTRGYIDLDPPSFEVVDTLRLEHPKYFEPTEIDRQISLQLERFCGYSFGPEVPPDKGYHVEFVDGRELIRSDTEWWVVPLGGFAPKTCIEPPFDAFRILGSTGP